MSGLEQIINDAFENIKEVSTATTGPIRDAVEKTLNQLDSGTLRVCEKVNGKWFISY